MWTNFLLLQPTFAKDEFDSLPVNWKTSISCWVCLSVNSGLPVLTCFHLEVVAFFSVDAVYGEPPTRQRNVNLVQRESISVVCCWDSAVVSFYCYQQLVCTAFEQLGAVRTDSRCACECDSVWRRLRKYFSCRFTKKIQIVSNQIKKTKKSINFKVFVILWKLY